MNNNPDRYGAVFQFPASELKKKRYFFDAGYHYDITQGWDASLNYTVNAEQLDWQVSQAAGQNHLQDRSETIEAIVHGNVSDDLNILLVLRAIMTAAHLINFYLRYKVNTSPLIPKWITFSPRNKK